MTLDVGGKQATQCHWMQVETAHTMTLETGGNRPYNELETGGNRPHNDTRDRWKQYKQ